MNFLDHALALASQGFHVFPLATGEKAPPKITDFPNVATRTEAVIRGWWGQWPDANVGISTTHFQDDAALLVVDVDNKGGKDGASELLRLELDGWELPDTYRCDTPTGGWHLFYRVVTPVRQGADVLAPGLDVRSRGGYCVGSGSVVAAGLYRAVPRACADAPAWLIAKCGVAPAKSATPRDTAPGPSIDPVRAAERATHYLQHEAPVACEGVGGDTLTYKVAARVKDFGVAEDAAVLLLAMHWNHRCEPPWEEEDLERKVAHAYEYGQQPIGASAPEVEFVVLPDPAPVPANGHAVLHPYLEMNKEYAFVVAGGGAHILWETRDAFDRYKLEHLSLPAFQAKFAPVTMMSGDKPRPLADLWMKATERRAYDGLVFMPSQDAPDRFYNLWRGFAYEPTPKYTEHPAVHAFLEHTRDNICGGDGDLCRWLLGYVAHLIQRPWEKPLVALVFRGAKGVGKNAFIERIGCLLGGHFLLTSNRRYLLGNFNGHLENCLLFALDEAFWSGDKQAEGALKDLITGREHVIEHKGKESYTVANKTRVVIIGNEDWLVPASHDERRFAVFSVGDRRKQDRQFFTAMREGMEAGGYAVLLRYLLDYDLAGLDINAAPSTLGLAEQKAHTLDPFEQWWFDCLDEGQIVGSEFGPWPETIVCDRFRAAFRRYAKERNIRGRMPEDRSIGKLLARCGPGVLKKRASKQNDGEQPHVYLLPSVAECRREWDTFIGHPTVWTL